MNVLNLLKKYKNTPVQAKASLWYTVCNILQRGISFIILPIYVRVLTTAEYGQYSLFQSWKEILIIFATLNLYCGVFTKAMVDYKGERAKYTSCMQGLSTIITTVVFVIYILGRSFWDSVFLMDSVTMFLLFAYFIFFPAFSFWSTRQRVEYKYVKMILVTLGTAVVIPAISLLLLYTTNLREKAVIWGYLFVQCSVGATFYIYHFIKGKTFYHKEYWKSALKFNIPLIPHYLSLIVLGQADRIMIRHYCGAAKVGIYNLAYQVSIVMNIVTSAINNSLVPWSYEKLKEKKYSAIKDITTKLCVILSVCTVGIIIVAPEVVRIIGTKEYMEAIWVIPAIAISSYFMFCYGLFSTVAFYYSETKYVMIASLVGAVLNIILNAIFIPMFDFVAAGYTTMVCYLTFMIMHYIFMRKLCKTKTEGNTPYPVSFIVLSVLLICVVAAIAMFFYNNFIVRWLFVLVMLGVAILNRNKILDVLKELK